MRSLDGIRQKINNMKRTGFRAPQYKATERAPLAPLYRPVTYSTADDFSPQPKSAPKRDESYRRWVASQPCWNCGAVGRSQAAHADAGKGIGIKSSDETLYPLCADQPMHNGCHTVLGMTGLFSQAERRSLEKTAAEDTKRRAQWAGAWPEGWPE